jgi:hypothetical protein
MDRLVGNAAGHVDAFRGLECSKVSWKKTNVFIMQNISPLQINVNYGKYICYEFGNPASVLLYTTLMKGHQITFMLDSGGKAALPADERAVLERMLNDFWGGSYQVSPCGLNWAEVDIASWPASLLVFFEETGTPVLSKTGAVLIGVAGVLIPLLAALLFLFNRWKKRKRARVSDELASYNMPLEKSGKTIQMNGIGKALVTILVIVAVLAVIAGRGCSRQGEPDSVPAATPAPTVSQAPIPTFDKPEQPLPSNGAATPTGGSVYDVTLTITTPDTYYNLLKLKDSSGNTVLEWFLYPNTQVVTAVPVGTYRMQFASGTAGYGWEELFGPDTVYGQFTDEFVFESDYEYTLELIPQVEGNLEEEQISPEEFQ